MKKAVKAVVFILVAVMAATMLVSCGAERHPDGNNYSPSPAPAAEGGSFRGGDEFTDITENPFLDPREHPSSSFALTVSTAAYPNLRRYIKQGTPIDKNMVRIEEIVNYFRYDYPIPEEGKPLSVTTGFFDCPWNPEAVLMTVGLKAEELELGKVKNNLVFLLDVSGSMYGPDRLGLMQEAFLMLLENLGENDRISIVTYAGSDRVLLSGESGANKEKIASVISDLTAGGSTAGARGIITAYEIAAQNFIKGGNNRLILATDGDFNVGVSGERELEELISQKKDGGVYLTVLGLGYGNLKSSKLEILANKGNGHYAYLDSVHEARKVLVEEMGGTLNTVARDAKARVEFNPDYVQSYRLIGYENLLLSEDEWREDKTDAGEIGSGFTVTAVYEVILKEGALEAEEDAVLYEVKVRYKSPDINDDEVHELSVQATINDYTDTPSEDMLFISALVELCLILRDSQYKGLADINNVMARVAALDLSDPYRREFAELLSLIKARSN